MENLPTTLIPPPYKKKLNQSSTSSISAT
uniref:Uncharacterized protein n=1 Tax=Rhizophora mucronata TaxID=61149 RepID=A0A2P2JJ77_RHIMU